MMTYKECWKILSKMNADVHYGMYKPSKARMKRECQAIGMLHGICQRADKEMEKENGMEKH